MDVLPPSVGTRPTTCDNFFLRNFTKWWIFFKVAKFYCFLVLVAKFQKKILYFYFFLLDSILSSIKSPKIYKDVRFFFCFHIFLLLNLVKSSYGWSPVQLHHMTEKKNPDYEKASFIMDPMAGVFEREWEIENKFVELHWGIEEIGLEKHHGLISMGRELGLPLRKIKSSQTLNHHCWKSLHFDNISTWLCERLYQLRTLY